MASPSPPTEPYTRYVLLPRLYLKRSRLCLLLNEIGDIARGVRNFCKGKRRELHHPSHLPLVLKAEQSAVGDTLQSDVVFHLIYSPEDSPESSGEGISLLGEQRMPSLGSFETKLGVG